MSHLKSVIIITIAVLLLDSIWLGYVGKKFYIDALADLMKSSNGEIEVNYFAAAITYILLILGMTFFVLPLAQDSISAALLWGGFFGLVCYGVYDCTNMAIIPKWPLSISIIDIIWGCILCSLSSTAAVLFKNYY